MLNLTESPPFSREMEDRGQGLKAASVAFICIDTVIVTLRFMSRFTGNKFGIWWDDWSALASLIFMIASCGVAIQQTQLGMGKHLVNVKSSRRSQQICTFVAEFTYTFSISLAKASVLFFYTRIFKVDKSFRRAALLVGCLVLGWGITFTFAFLFQCMPIRKAWDSQITGHCFDIVAVFIGGAVSDFVIDVIILLLPMPMLYRLEMNRLRKFGLVSIFLIGYSAAAVSVARLAILLRLRPLIFIDITWNYEPFVLFNIIEQGIALASVCFPSVISIFNHWVRDIIIPSLRSAQQAQQHDSSTNVNSGINDGYIELRTGNGRGVSRSTLDRGNE